VDPGRRKAIGTLAGGLLATTSLGSESQSVLADTTGNSPANPPRDAGDSLSRELADLGAADAVALMRSGSVSAEEYARDLIARFNTHEHLNVFISRDDQALLAAARAADERLAKGESAGPLHGLPILLKDNIETIGLPTSGGTPALNGRQTTRNAVIAQSLFDAGALLAGKANLHELAAGGSIGCIAGQPINPYDPGVRPGGSSSGNGVAIAARLLPAAIGTDTGGSVRIPASLCGISALRPTFGRYSNTGILPISRSRDTPGPMARSIKDLALIDGVITNGPTELDAKPLNGLRLGVPRGYCFAILDEQTSSVTEQALELLSRSGVVLVNADIPNIDETTTEIRSAIARIEIGRDLPAYLEESGGGIRMERLIAEICNPQTRAMFEQALPNEAEILEVRSSLRMARERLTRSYTEYFASHRLDAIVFPTTPLPARPLEQVEEVEIDGRMMSSLAAYNRNTMPGSSIGLPGISIPSGLTPGGLPVGLGLDGLHGSDRTLLAIASALETILEPLPAPGE
jgi:Asp-tRNA(Asn)/Glu-tRNA(Gln) amidotransferase A subunit family amidase